MRISDWSSDVCSSDLPSRHPTSSVRRRSRSCRAIWPAPIWNCHFPYSVHSKTCIAATRFPVPKSCGVCTTVFARPAFARRLGRLLIDRSEEHTSELQSQMRTSYAVIYLTKKNIYKQLIH